MRICVRAVVCRVKQKHQGDREECKRSEKDTWHVNP
jgi:hypothetical protein